MLTAVMIVGLFVLAIVALIVMVKRHDKSTDYPNSSFGEDR